MFHVASVSKKEKYTIDMHKTVLYKVFFKLGALPLAWVSLLDLCSWLTETLDSSQALGPTKWCKGYCIKTASLTGYTYVLEANHCTVSSISLHYNIQYF